MHWKPPVIGIVLTMVAGCTDQPGPKFTNPPPERFREDGGYLLVTASAEVIAEVCGNPAARFCAVGGTIYAPNPCGWGDAYAKGICHEAGHAQGWPADHSR